MTNEYRKHMKNIYKYNLAMLVLFLATAPAALAGNIPCLCQPTETVIFSCQIKNSQKIASLCASKIDDPNNGYLQYRFGRKNKIEMEFPRKNDGSASRFFYSDYARYQVTRQSLRFVNSDYEYTIEIRSEHDETPPVQEASIEVSGKSNAILECANGRWTGISMEIRDHVPCDPENPWGLEDCPRPTSR